MVTVEYERSQLREMLREVRDRAADLRSASEDAAAALVRQNARLNFDPGHRASNLDVDDTRIAMGSESVSYARLLTMDGDELAGIYRARLFDER